MLTTPNMGLKVWDQPGDFFSYSDLATNQQAIDAHDHTTGKGVQIPTAGLINNAVSNTKLADLAVTTAKIVDANVTLAKLAATASPDPLYTNWKTVAITPLTQVPAATAAATYAIPMGPTAAPPVVINYSGVPATMGAAFWFDPADWTVSGRTAQYRLRLLAVTGSTAPGGTWTMNWRRIASVAGASVFPNVLGDGVAFTQTDASIIMNAPNSILAQPSTASTYAGLGASYHMLTVAIGTATVAASPTWVSGQIQVRQV
jgi:hypothetical protein